MKTEELKHQTHFVSPESPAGQPTKVDEQHASIETGHPDPLMETQDGLGVIEGANSQQAADGSDPREIGGEDELESNPAKRPWAFTGSATTDSRKPKPVMLT